jgi:Skp family chaperone for outer membrane proteins
MKTEWRLPVSSKEAELEAEIQKLKAEKAAELKKLRLEISQWREKANAQSVRADQWRYKYQQATKGLK